MKAVRVYRLNNLSKSQFNRLKAAQQEAAAIWNECMETHQAARQTHAKWPGRNELQKATKGRYALHCQSILMVVHAFLAYVVTTLILRNFLQHMKMRYPYLSMRFYP